MKGDYVKEEQDHHSHTMFAKLHQTQKFHHHPHHPPPPHQPQHHHQQHPQPPPPGLFHHPPFNPRECQTSEEVDSQRSPATPSTTTTNRDPSSAAQHQQQIVHLQAPSSAGNDGATIEVVRRPRGRPPGSKNKPKPPVIITRDTEPSMSPYILEISGGVDILETIMTFCRKRNTGLCILNGSGTVSNVTLRQPSTTPGASVTFHGRFDILSLSATILPPTNGYSASGSGSVSSGIANGFTISLAGPQGQVVGGTVMGPLFTAGTVFLVAATFNSPLFHKLPLEEERVQHSGSAAAGGSSGGNEGRHQSPSAVSGGDGSGQATTGQAAVDSSCGGGGGGGGGGVSMYSCHMASDVIWAPTARQPQHPPPY
ncbi:OLC1v1017238C1 [Oldenlandia corymbosa var. corymbosa]|uniref:OLC1v1017238C1 n=1 Tax=Oldenlandia corymbosa var. corymbosa TaxID=529605 RepID=A0AAV1E8Y4_OLDCO|nr:OLC1v1017238C1 [Oldenlandia corymbosa var. corymbosa]